MKEAKKKYQPPTITKVKFEDKSLVAFEVCKKQTQVERDVSCCTILPQQTGGTNPDPS